MPHKRFFLERLSASEHKANLCVFALYVLISVALTIPLPFQMDQCLAGDDIDVWINPWANWWTQKALSEEIPLYYTRYMFYPQGVSLAYHSFSHTNTALWLLLQHLVGDLPAYNLTVLMTYPLSALALYLLAHRLTRSRLSAFVAGFIFAFSPYHVAESAHPVLGTTQWIPLFLLSLENAITHRRIRAGLMAAFWLWLTALSGWHLLTLAFSLGVCRVLYLLFTRHKWKDWRLLRLLLISLIAFAMLTLPFMWPLLREQFVSDTPGYLAAHQEAPADSSAWLYAGTDLLAFFTPSNYHPLLGQWVNGIYEQRFFPLERWKRPAFIGYSVLALGCLGILRSGRQGRFWWIASIVLFVLALGPYPRLLGKPLFSQPLPWSIPLVQLIRHGERVNILFTLCWSLLAAWGCVALLQRVSLNPGSSKVAPRGLSNPRFWSGSGDPGRAKLDQVSLSQSQRRKWLLVGVISLLVFFEYCPVPFPVTCLQVPRFYFDVAQEPGDFAILEIPMGRQPAKVSLYYQTIHERPLVEGVVSRLPPQAYDFIESNQLLSLLRRYSILGYGGYFTFPFPDVSRQLGTLAEAGVRYVVFHRDMTPPAFLDAWQSFVVVDPIYDDASIVVYRTRPVAGVDYKAPDRLTETLGLLRMDNHLPYVVSQAAWLQFDLYWVALESPCREYHYRVTLRNSSGKAIATYDVELAPEWSTDQWPAGTLFTSHFAGQIDPFLPAGLYDMIVEVLDPVTAQTIGTPANLGSLEVQALRRQYTRPQVSTEVNIDFGDQIRLVGYDVERTTRQVDLTLCWISICRMEQDYKIFVHLSSMDDGALVAQNDGMPRGWTYPTSWWDKDEVVTDTITLDVSGSSPGRYEISVGIYDPNTLERLSATNQAGVLLPKQRFVLPFVVDLTDGNQ